MKDESDSPVDGAKQLDLATLFRTVNMTLASTSPDHGVPTLWIGSPVGSDPTPFDEASSEENGSQERYEPCLKDVIVISFMLSLWLYSIWLMFR